MPDGQEALTIPKGAKLGSPVPQGATLGGDSKPPLAEASQAWTPNTLGEPNPRSLQRFLFGGGDLPRPSLSDVGSEAWRQLKEMPGEMLRSLGTPTGAAGAMLGGGLKGPSMSMAPPVQYGGVGLPEAAAAKPKSLAIPGATSTAEPLGTAKLPPVPASAPTPFPTVPKASLGVSPTPQWFPEPRPETPIDRPGSMWSVDRPSLPSRATRGQPGALDVLTNIGDRPPLVMPRPTLGVADPEFSALRGRSGLFPGSDSPTTTSSGIATEIQPESQGGGIPQGSPTLFSQLPPYQPDVIEAAGGESRIEQLKRGAAGESPEVKSLRRNTEKRAEGRARDAKLANKLEKK